MIRNGSKHTIATNGEYRLLEMFVICGFWALQLVRSIVTAIFQMLNNLFIF